MKLVSKFSAGFDGIIVSLAVLAAAMCVLLMLGVSTNVVLRYFFDKPILGMETVCEFFLLWLTFLGTAWVLKRGKHVRIDLAVNRLTPKAQTVLNIILSIIGAVIFLFIVWYGAIACWDYIQRGVWLPMILRPLKGIAWAIIPIGSFVLAVQFLRNAYGYLRSLW